MSLMTRPVKFARFNLDQNQLALSACPSRDLLYTKLKEDPNGEAPATDEELNEALTKWLNALDEIVKKLNLFLYGDAPIKAKLKL